MTYLVCVCAACACIFLCGMRVNISRFAHIIQSFFFFLSLSVSGRKKPKPVPKDDVDEVDGKPTSKRLSLGVQGWMDVDTTPSWDVVFFYWARRVLLVSEGLVRYLVMGYRVQHVPTKQANIYSSHISGGIFWLRHTHGTVADQHGCRRIVHFGFGSIA